MYLVYELIYFPLYYFPCVSIVVATVKETDTKRKIKLSFSGIVARGDINKKEDISSTNNRNKNIVKEMGPFLSIKTILMHFASTKAKSI